MASTDSVAAASISLTIASMRTHRTASKSQRAGSAVPGRRQTVPSTVASQAVEGFIQLIQYAKIKTTLELTTTDNKGNGLIVASGGKHKKGQVLMRVPRSLALVLDYEQGLQLPSEGSWPRVKDGVTRDEPLPWEMLFALALLDGLAGQGGKFWGAYCQAVLPPPEALTLPLCWSPARLAALQHDAITEAALAQQARLKALFPALSDPVDEDSCSWLQWAFACTRSRSFRLGEDSHAIVPFMDLTNHSSNPNADFRQSGDAFELYALRDLSVGEEVTIQYAGDDPSMTNQRWQAVYGFVPAGGNMSDRITLDPTLDQATTNSTNTTNTQEEGVAEPEAPGLLLSRLQEGLGDTMFFQAISGQHRHLHAALRSLPLQREDLTHLDEQFNDAMASGVMPTQVAQGPEGAEGAQGGAQEEAGRALAAALRRQCEQQLEACGTSVEADEAELTAARGFGAAEVDVRHMAALQYRIERKRLLKSAIILLDVYSRV